MVTDDLDLDALAEALADFAPPEKKSGRGPREERIIAGFEEIQRFVEQQGRPLIPWRKMIACKRVDMAGRAELDHGTTAVASISTLARDSTSATTCTSAIAGKCLPITSRYASPSCL